MDVQDFRTEVTIIQLHCEASSVSKSSLRNILSFRFKLLFWHLLVIHGWKTHHHHHHRHHEVMYLVLDKSLLATMQCRVHLQTEQVHSSAWMPPGNILIYVSKILNCITWTACRQHITVNSVSGCYIWAARFTSTASSGLMLAFAHERCHVTAATKVPLTDFFMVLAHLFPW